MSAIVEERLPSDVPVQGGNMTGFTPFQYDIGGKWLQLLKDTVPSLTHATLAWSGAAAHAVRGFTIHSRLRPVRDRRPSGPGLGGTQLKGHPDGKTYELGSTRTASPTL